MKPWRTERALCGLFSSAPSAYTQGRGLPSVWETLSGSEEKIYIRLLCPGMEKKQDVYGFYDTGNLLTDPVNGSPVSVAEADALKKILSEELTVRLKHLKENPGELECTEIAGLRPRYLSCRTVGQKQCLMLTVTLDELCIRTPGEEVRIIKPVIALAFEPSALGKEYKVLLNSRLLH